MVVVLVSLERSVRGGSGLLVDMVGSCFLNSSTHNFVEPLDWSGLSLALVQHDDDYSDDVYATYR